MSLILKGIDLPTRDQVIVIHSDGTFNEVDPFARRLMPVYKAIQISKGHGDIIDRNDIYIGRWDIDTDLAEQLLNAPIILESERNNEPNT